eukprot:CAMPEP_0177246176 /NCGR_PEP_ID=MMETSP0367-20130122/50866_1 /TAXON_ID=447022 ORGANISM="Scrippsiella hangoei-like, Strain SHHI-4" /NCGR_SAMPLE_ID=MMETSP0367 /ASSEMBLY_ACC=CAM_ASM_000362 /LENGTH=140 /DNA_ID=CAMNT_0018698171 /DNA_START=27 /DNA_END=450 /DNA_ORIENTATION=-
MGPKTENLKQPRSASRGRLTPPRNPALGYLVEQHVDALAGRQVRDAQQQPRQKIAAPSRRYISSAVALKPCAAAASPGSRPMIRVLRTSQGVVTNALTAPAVAPSTKLSCAASSEEPRFAKTFCRQDSKTNHETALKRQS